ncbi:MAG: zinc ribbon domain-containing protein [Clostridia bacterium]|nr:zinc ribbon domain-containing protein [Clostridia bacterium]
MKCPNCGSPIPDGASFCTTCGYRASAPESSYTAPAVPAAAPVPTPAAGSSSKGKAITSVILGPSGLAFAVSSIIFIIVGFAIYRPTSWRLRETAGVEFTLGWVFALIGIGLAIPALILGIKALRNPSGAGKGMGKAGKITGLISLILNGVLFLLGFIMFIVCIA